MPIGCVLANRAEDEILTSNYYLGVPNVKWDGKMGTIFSGSLCGKNVECWLTILQKE